MAGFAIPSLYQSANDHRYPDSQALTLRQALARRFEVEPDMVLCTNGSDEIILLLCLAFLSEGDEVVMAQGSFISYYLCTIGIGARAVRVPLCNCTHDLDAMADAVTKRTRLLFLCNPNNPTGTINSAVQVARLLERVPQDVLVVADEAYIEFVEQADYPDLLRDLRAGRQNLVLLRTFSKIYGLAGLRLGYALGNRNVIGYLEHIRLPFNTNALAQAAGLAAIEDEEHIVRSRAYIAACRAQFADELRALDLEPIPSKTNFITVNVGDDIVVSSLLLQQGVNIKSLSAWGMPGYIRVSFGTSEENARFFEALRNVLDK